MTHWTEDREQSLFLLCLEIPPAARSALLDAECDADPSLRSRIERLLAAYESAAGATLNPLSGIGEEGPPERVGAYRILGVLGEGGMGVVYDAMQEEPLRRSVALKILKPGMDTRRVIERFRREQQALAALDHVYIAKVFNAGQTERGRPYFVMERVSGTPLLAYADSRILSIRERVSLLMLVCEAVQHAHQKGLIHRDLKPTNILVGGDAAGGAPMPKVIDFGIAKAVSAEGDDEGTQWTELGQALGTPVYMAPEQAAMGRLDVDTRADIYGLGVVFYELLCGRLPAEPDQGGTVAFLSALAKCELVAPRPSDRTVGDLHEQTGMAAARGASPGTLRKQLRGDLDVIALKAIEPLRERRYQTVAAFADDLRRYLEGEPVSARPATAGYRLGRFLRRNRLQASAAAAVLLALVAGTVASTLGYLRATHAEQQARMEAQTASQVSDFVVKLFELADPSEARGNSVTVSEVIDRGERSIETELAGEPALQGRFLTTLAGVNQSLGRYQRAQTLAANAQTKFVAAGGAESTEMARAELAEAKALFRLNRLSEAEAAATHAIGMRKRLLGESHADVAEVLNELGGIAWMRDRFADAEQLHRQALAIYEASSDEASGGSEHVGVAASMRGLGLVTTSVQRYQESLNWHRKALPIYVMHHGAEHRRVADTYDSIGLALEGLKRRDEAIENMRRSLALREKILGAEHETLGYSHHNLGRVLARNGNTKQALEHYQRGLELRERALGPEHPLTGLLVESIGLLEMQHGDAVHGVQLLERSLAINRQALGETHGETLESRRNLMIGNLMLKRYPAALLQLQELLARNPPKYLDVDLDDKDLAPLRSYPEFVRLREERARREALIAENR